MQAEQDAYLRALEAAILNPPATVGTIDTSGGYAGPYGGDVITSSSVPRTQSLSLLAGSPTYNTLTAGRGPAALAGGPASYATLAAPKKKQQPANAYLRATVARLR